MLLLILVCVSAFAPLGGGSRTEPLRDASLQTYLSNFGYLPKAGPNTRNQLRVADVENALKELQDFAGLKTTGKVDRPTRQLLTQKRCGLPDRSNKTRTKRAAPILWHKNELTYGIKNWTPKMGPMKVRRAIYDAAKMWSDVSALEVREVNDMSRADIVISFREGDHGDGYDFDGQGVVLAHAFYPGPDMGGDIHFDAAENWSEDATWTNLHDILAVQLFATATHEIGHSLGMDHVKNRESIMYPYYFKVPKEKQSRLPYPDILTVQNYYGTGSNTVPPSTVKTTTTTPIPTTTTTREPRTPPPRVPAKELNVCEIDPSAVAFVRSEIIVFHGMKFWRLDEKGYQLGRGAEASHFFAGLPENLTGIDAAYEKANEDKILIFSGTKYWKYFANSMQEGYPKSITDMGLPASLDKIDAIFKWGYNGKSYIMAGNKYWRINEDSELVDPDYPRDASVWKGVPIPVDGAFSLKNGDTYFVKNGGIYKFDGRRMRVEAGWPKTAEHVWGHCKKQEHVSLQ